MKHNKYLILFIGILFFVAGCSSEVKSNAVKGAETGREIEVEKPVEKEGNYEFFKEITDDDTIQNAKDILSSIEWENAEVNMTNSPYCKFSLREKTEQPEPNETIYYMWISPQKDKIELVIEGEAKYAQLSEGQSAELFETITGEKLSDVN